jgi:hypothetical protein
MVISNASRGDIPHANTAKCEKCGVCDLGLVADANAPVPVGEPDIGFRYRCFRDSWQYAKARRQLPEKNGLIPLASVNRYSRYGDGWGGRGCQRPGASVRCSRRLAVGHASSQGSAVLPARIRFPICQRYAPDGGTESTREPVGEPAGPCGSVSPTYRKPHTRRQHQGALTGGMNDRELASARPCLDILLSLSSSRAAWS